MAADAETERAPMHNFTRRHWFGRLRIQSSASINRASTGPSAYVSAIKVISDGDRNVPSGFQKSRPESPIVSSSTPLPGAAAPLSKQYFVDGPGVVGVITYSNALYIQYSVCTAYSMCVQIRSRTRLSESLVAA